MNFLYPAAKQALLNGGIMELIHGDAELVKVEYKPCLHSISRKVWDRMRGRPHGPFHKISTPLLRVALNTEHLSARREDSITLCIPIRIA